MRSVHADGSDGFADGSRSAFFALQRDKMPMNIVVRETFNNLCELQDCRRWIQFALRVQRINPDGSRQLRVARILPSPFRAPCRGDFTVIHAQRDIHHRYTEDFFRTGGRGGLTIARLLPTRRSDGRSGGFRAVRFPPLPQCRCCRKARLTVDFECWMTRQPTAMEEFVKRPICHHVRPLADCRQDFKKRHRSPVILPVIGNEYVPTCLDPRRKLVKRAYRQLVGPKIRRPCCSNTTSIEG